MSVLRGARSRIISHKLKRSIAFKGWRRNVSGKEKFFAQLPNKVKTEEL